MQLYKAFIHLNNCKLAISTVYTWPGLEVSTVNNQSKEKEPKYKRWQAHVS